MNPEITCPDCLRRLSECPTNEHGLPLADLQYNVGNPAKPSMGHAMYFTDTGRTALCIARPLREVARA